MKIFSIRDRMLDYYSKPIFADNKSDVLSAISTAINRGESNDFCQTPEHFEVWELGELNIETGEIESKRTIITNCASLIRNSIRGREQPGANTPTGAPQAGDTPSPPTPGLTGDANGPKTV